MAILLVLWAPPLMPAAPAIDPYGDPLPEGAIARLGTVRFRHGGGIYSFTYSPDGKTLASSGGDQTIRLWDVATGKEIRRFGDGTKLAAFLTFSPDGKTLSGCFSNELWTWDVATGKEVNAPRTAPKELIFSSISGDARRACSRQGQIGGKEKVQIWDIASGQAIQEIESDAADFGRFRLSPDGSVLAYNTDDYTYLRFADVAAGKEVAKAKVKSESRNLVLAFSPDGRTMAFPDRDSHSIRLWNVSDRQPSRELCGHQRLVKDVVFGRDGQTLASIDLYGHIRIWDAAGGRELRHWQAPVHVSVCSDLSPDGTTLAVGDRFGSIRFWDVATGKEVGPCPGNPGYSTRIHVRPDETTAVMADFHAIHIWDLRTGKLLRRISPTIGDELIFPAGALSADGKHFAYSIGDAEQKHRVEVVDLESGKPAFRAKMAARPGCLVFTADSKQLIVAENGGTLRFWDLASGKEAAKMKGDQARIFSLAVSPDGRLLYSAAFEDTQPGVQVWDLASRKQVRRVGTEFGQIEYCAVSPDGKTLTCFTRNETHFLDVQTGRRRRSFQYERHGGSQIAILSPDGRMVATSGQNGAHYSLSLWELASGKERHRFTGHTGQIHDLRFFSDRKRIVSTSYDTTSLVWDLALAAGSENNSPDPKEVEAIWSDLAVGDAAKAFTAMRALIAGGNRSVAFLKGRLKPVAAAKDEKQIARVVADLDGGQFAMREKAMAELTRLAEQAEPQLRKTLADKPSAEARRRIEQLLTNLEKPITSPERLRTLRAIEVLEHIGTPEATAVLEGLAKGAPAALETQDAKGAVERLRK